MMPSSMPTWMKKKLSRLKQEPWWLTLTKTFAFVVHFFVVMSLLCFGALALAWLEEYDVMLGEKGEEKQSEIRTTAVTSTTTNGEFEQHTNGLSNKSRFWADIEAKYKFTLLNGSRDGFLREIAEFLKHHERLQEEHAKEEGHHKHTVQTQVPGKKFVFMKWFYFVIIATTTIYGHVYPKTNNGKLFYILFSLIGIVLMMTLLRSCGKILMALNKKFYTFIRRHLCKGKEYVSDQFTSVISMCFIFLVFMMLVVWHDKNIGAVENWSWTDTFYFWLVTFTTVGFGDVHFPLEVEVEHFYELIFYRVVGLSFLAGIIESIHEYIKYHKSTLLMRHNKRRILRKVTGKKKSIGDRCYRNSERISANPLLE